MGRSVSYLRNAYATAYFHPEIEDRDQWLDLVEDIQETIKSNFPKFTTEDHWEDRENHVILDGYGCKIAISEYCGLACLSIGLSDYFDHGEDAAEKWMADNYEAIFEPWNDYRKVGSMSNGEGVFHKVN